MGTGPESRRCNYLPRLDRFVLWARESGLQSGGRTEGETGLPRRVRGQESLFPTESRLFYGDNLRILRDARYIRPESVDLVYLDPPFKPTEKYNVLFRTHDGRTPAAAQVRAFTDTWRWDEAASQAYHDVMENTPQRVARTLEALRTILGQSDIFAYLCMMAPRLVELWNVLSGPGASTCIVIPQPVTISRC
jgi:hypothetical protein